MWSARVRLRVQPSGQRKESEMKREEGLQTFKARAQALEPCLFYLENRIREVEHGRGKWESAFPV